MNSHPEDASLVIHRATDKGFPFEVHGPGGQRWENTVIQADAAGRVEELTNRLEDLLGTGDQTGAANCLQELGRYLFSALNDDDGLRKTLQLAQLVPAERALRLQLRVRDERLRAWPLELLYDEQETLGDPFLALSPHILLSHYHEQPTPIPRPERLVNLRVLVVTASPKDYLSLDHVIQHHFHSLEVLSVSMSRLELKVCQNATRQSLWQRLTEVDYPFHVIHFIGHGYFIESEDASLPQSGVILEKENGQSDRVPPEEFAAIIRESQIQVCLKEPDFDEERRGTYPQLVILDACQSARATYSVADRLVKERIPAVIGMRFQASVILINHFNEGIFNEGIFSSLLDGYPIDQVVAECRRQLKNEFGRHHDWNVPVLYLRAKDGILFEFNPDSNERAKWLEKLKLLRQLAGSQAGEAMRELLMLGTSAIALSVAAVLTYPLASVRAKAAELLHSLPYTAETHDKVIVLIGPAIASEPDVNVKREMARIVAQPRPSRLASTLLNNLKEDPDPEVRKIAANGLALQQTLRADLSEAELLSMLATLYRPTLNTDLNILFNVIVSNLNWVSTTLNYLDEIADTAMQGYTPSVDRVQKLAQAIEQVKILHDFLVQARARAVHMNRQEVLDAYKQQTDDLINRANETIVTAARAASTAIALTEKLEFLLQETIMNAGVLRLVPELDALIVEAAGVIIRDRSGETNITINRKPLDVRNEKDGS